MDALTFRPATTKDLPTLRQFEQGVIEAERPFNPTLKPSKIHYYDLEALLNNPDAVIILGEIDGQIVTSGYVKILDAKPQFQFNQYAYMGFMYVLPEHRGKGINKLLLNELIAWAKARGIQEVRLDVYDENMPAVRAYEKRGFKKLLVEMRLEI